MPRRLPARRADGAGPARVALVLATSTGGVGRHVAALARGLAGRGHVVAVLGPVATNARFGFDVALGLDAGLGSDAVVAREGRVPAFRGVEIASGFRPVVAARAALRLRRLTRGADVVHAHGLRAGVLAAVALGRWRSASSASSDGAARRRPTLVVTLHNAMLGDGFRARALGAVMRRLARVVDAALVVSPDLADALAPARTRRALVAAAPRTVARTVAREPCETRTALGIPATTSLLLAVGRLHPQKGLDVLVDAIAEARGKLASAVVIVAGDGPERAGLERRVAAGGVDVRLLGDRGDVAELLRAADVVVMPSRWEGWPLAAAEALAAGRPLVATRVGGLPELVGDAALLVAPEDPGALADALERVLADPWLARDLAAKASARAADLPTDEDVVAQVSACYQRILRR